MKLKDLQDVYKDEKLIFVCGAGPSLHFVDPDLIKDYPIIAVNSAIVKFQERANIFLSDDIGAKNWNYYTQILPRLSCVKLLYRKKLEKFCNHFKKEEVVLFDHTWWCDPKNKTKNPVGLVLTKDAEKPIIGSRTSLGAAVHFAYIAAGPETKIILLGSDCCLMNYQGLKRYFWQFPDEPRVYRLTGEPVFCRNNAGTMAGHPIDSHSRDFLGYWRAFMEQNRETPHLHIINASGGILDVFERMELENVLESYGLR
jgi:hypothetical protein